MRPTGSAPEDNANLPTKKIDGLDDKFLRTSASEAPTVVPAPPPTDGDDPRIGEVIGHFQLQRALGEGGMGKVYLAKQFVPVERYVALKVLRDPMTGPATARRLKAEQQSLALMEHPGIARLFEAGTTPEGQPYLAMEYVDGAPIDVFCDRQRLGVKERVEVVRQVAEAMQHAHQKGILHRDLKPSNLLVTEVDGRPQPKVIDFGLAKSLLEDESTPGLTRVGTFVGTPVFMSPEQADGEPVDVRTDVYGLAMVLYRLLSGHLPFGEEITTERNPRRQLALMREAEIPRPSARLSRAEVGAEVAACRRTTEAALVAALRSELDWIVLKGLDRDRELRYPGVGELLADLRSYLEGRPVGARPADRIYTLRKFASRHRAGVVASSSILLALVIGSAAATVGLVKATRANARATLETEKAQAINDFLTGVLASPDPHEGRRDIQVAEVLKNAYQRLQAEFQDRPRVRAALLTTIAKSFHQMGDPERAEEILQEASAIAIPKDAIESLAAAVELGEVYGALGRYREAAEVSRQVVERTESPEGRDLTIRFAAQTNLSVILPYLGEHDEAARQAEEAYEGRRRVMGEEHPTTLGALGNMILAKHSSQPESTLELSLELLERKRAVLGPKHPSTLATLQSIGDLYIHGGEAGKAEPILRQTWELCREVFGPRHVRTARAASDVARSLLALARYVEAEPFAEEATDTLTQVMGAEDFVVLRTRQLLLQSRFFQGRVEEAERLARDLVSDIVAQEGELSVAALNVRSRHAQSLFHLDRPQEALELLEHNLELELQQAAEEGTPNYAAFRSFALDASRAEEPDPKALERARRAAEGSREADSDGAVRAELLVARLLSKVAQHDEALALFERHLSSPDATAATPARLLSYGEALERAGRDPLGLFKRARQHAASMPPGDRWKLDWAVGRSLPDSQAEEAESLLRQALSGCERSRGPVYPDLELIRQDLDRLPARSG